MVKYNVLSLNGNLVIAAANNERLDLPGQHELLALAMCDKISRSFMERYRPEIVSQLAILNEGRVVDELGLYMWKWETDELLGNFRH